MAFALKGTGSASTANSVTADQSSLVVTTATTAGAVGDLAILLYAVDNNQTTDGDENAVTSVVDSAGNQWRKAVEFTNGQGTAQTGAVCGLWFCNLRAALAIGGTVTLTFNNVTSRDASAASLTYYTKATGFNAELAGVPGTLANDAVAAGSLNSTTANIACLRVRGIASESSTVTALTPTASFAIVTQAVAVIAAATSQGIRGEWIINTGTGTASAPTAGAGAVDNASVYVAFLEVPVTDWLQPLSLPVRRVTRVAYFVDDGLFASPTTPPAAGWFQPLSLPVWRKLARIEGESDFAAVAANMKWFAPLTEPVRQRRGLVANQPAFFAPVTASEVITVDKWFVSFSGPVRKVSTPKVNLFPFAAVAASPVTISWFTPLSEPVRTVRAAQRPIPLPFTAQAATPATVAIDWFTPFSDPVRRKTSPANQQVLALAPNPIVPTGWSVPLSEPTKARQRAIADYAYAPLAVSEVVTIDKWFSPLAPPQNAKRGLNAALQQAYTTEYFPDATNANAGQWFGSFADPVRIQSRFSAIQQTFTIGYRPDNFAQWFNPLSDPTRPKPTLSTANQQALAYVSPVVVVAPSQSWFAPLTDPVRRVPAAQKVNLFPFAVVAVVQAPVSIGWFAPLSEPVRKVPTAQKAYPLPFTAQAAAAEIITVDKWFVSLSEPVRTKPQLTTALQQSVAFVKAAPFPSVTESRFDQAWSEPLRRKAGLSAANQAAFFAPTTVITTENITVDKWFESLSGPTRRKPDDYDRYKGENEFTAVAANMKWFAPLTEPVRQKIGLPVTQQQALAFVATVSEAITIDKWFASFSEPVRIKASLLTARQQSLTWPTQIIIPSLASWWRPLSDPPKAKAGLAAARQQFETQSADFIPHPNQYLEGWYNWLSEPVRTKPGLSARFQSSWIGPHRVISTTITLSMSATETGVDVATFAITVLPYNPPASAVVSLKEIGTGASLTSIVEIGDDGSITSVVET